MSDVQLNAPNGADIPSCADTPLHEVSRPEYWQARYEQGKTGWDLQGISQPLQAYFDQLNDTDQKILIVGAGHAYEASYLHKLGFCQIYVLDFAKYPLSAFADNHPDFPVSRLLHQDFFELDKAEGGQFVGFFDVIVEQTFLSAIDPNRREQYAKQMHRLLKPQGKLVGVLLDCQFEISPPFGGSLAEYRALFEPYFDIRTMARCDNSIKPRAGRELFINLVKKSLSG